jgi:molybdopterin-guanine dinucleotide biosynthesis protein A
MISVEGFILAGGASSRMGKDKSRLLLDGRTLTEIIAASLSNVVSSVTVIGRNADDLGLKSCPDLVADWGALGGVHAALATCQNEWALVVACDIPFASPQLFERLVNFKEGFEAVAPIQKDGYPQPLCALYRVEPCLERAEALIAEGERRPITLLEAVNTRWVTFDELRDLADSGRFFDNINTPDDYAHALKKEVPSRLKDELN